MWFASSDGLNRFTGKACRVYHHLNADTNSLSSDNINAIFEDSKQRLWIATRNGLNLYDPITDNFKRFHHDPSNKNSISNNEVWSLAEDNQGSLWVGTMGGGLNKLVEPKKDKTIPGGYSFIHFRHDSASASSLSDDIVWSIAFDKSGGGWIGTNNGLNRFSVKDAGKDKINFTHYFNSSDKNSIAANIIWRVRADNNNNLIWLLSFSGMLDCIEAGKTSQPVRLFTYYRFCRMHCI
jgi:ligand-binding sensor domain-containing protein